MTVADIKREKGHIVRLSFEGGESAVLDLDFCAEQCIHKGDSISPEKLKEYIAESDYIRAKSRAMWLLDRYNYSSRRLEEKLKKAGFSAAACNRAIERLVELGLLNDGNLAQLYAEDFARRGVSKREAYGKLILKGIPPEAVKRALDGAEFDEPQQIEMLIEKKYARRLLEGETDKVYAALIRKGFSYGAVRDALKKYSEELEINGEV